jgi:hypothetical protein
MHPDLFGGYTPIMIEVPVEESHRRWSVRVRVVGYGRVDVTAQTEEEAMRVAREECDPWDCDYDVEIVSATPGDFVTPEDLV